MRWIIKFLELRENFISGTIQTKFELIRFTKEGYSGALKSTPFYQLAQLCFIISIISNKVLLMYLPYSSTGVTKIIDSECFIRERFLHFNENFCLTFWIHANSLIAWRTTSLTEDTFASKNCVLLLKLKWCLIVEQHNRRPDIEVRFLLYSFPRTHNGGCVLCSCWYSGSRVGTTTRPYSSLDAMQ